MSGVLSEVLSGGASARYMRIPVTAVPPALRTMLEALKRKSAPIVLGAPAGGQPQQPNRALNAILTEDGQHVHIASAPLMRLLSRAEGAAQAADAPLAVILRAEPSASRCRLWLSPAGSGGAALESPALPPGVQQVGAAGLAEAAAAARPCAWHRLDDRRTVVVALADTFADAERVRVPVAGVPESFAAVAGGGGGTAPLFLGPPGERPAGDAPLQAKLSIDRRISINNAQLKRRLAAALAAAAAAGAPLDVAFRAEPTKGACFLWLAPAGAAGAALEQPELPAGVAQLSSADVA